MRNTHDLRRLHMKEVRMEQIVKRFPGVLANDHIDFDLKAGEIHALLGENGAGKSTLVRQLFGLYRPDEGKIYINNKEQHFRSPQDAIAAGIGMIHQHFMLVPELTVVENVALGLRSSRGLFLDLDRVRIRVRELGEKYSLKVDPDAYIWQLAVGEQQRVEILKALYRGAEILILDEPTAVLTPKEVDDLFKILKQMAQDDHLLIFISHKLNEVLTVSNRVTVLRDGKVVGERPTKGATKAELAQMMVGRPVILQYDYPPARKGDIKLKVEDLHVMGDRGTKALKGVSFEIYSGEILGLAGVSGNGQRELAEALTGLHPICEGKVILDGKDVTHASPAQHIAAGQSYIPEERMLEGVIKDFSVAENFILAEHAKLPFSRSTFLNFKAIEAAAQEAVEVYNVKTPNIHTPIKSLSGGNIQKLILARELSRHSKVLIAAQPTRGVDIGASEYIHRRLLDQRTGSGELINQKESKKMTDKEIIHQMIKDAKTKGTAILLISEDLDEIRALSDRIAVIYEGKIVGIVDKDNATLERLGLMMAGVQGVK